MLIPSLSRSLSSRLAVSSPCLIPYLTSKGSCNKLELDLPVFKNRSLSREVPNQCPFFYDLSMSLLASSISRSVSRSRLTELSLSMLKFK
jgi:hypothetical protein